MTAKKIKILLVSSEVAPLVKTGGLADVAGELPNALKKPCCDIRIALPFYSKIPKDKFNINPLNKKITISIGKGQEEINLFETSIFNNIPVYLIDHNEFFSRKELYKSDECDYPDNDKRFILLSKAVLEMLPYIDFIPDIIHCNDWQTGLIPLYLKNFYPYKTKSVFTIHNLAYQGLFPVDTLESAGLGQEYYNINSLEFYGKISFLKAGIIYSDIITTVSPKYAEEIQTKEFGCGLEGLLLAKKNNIVGIINGIDYNVWNPISDKIIKKQYDEKDLKGKKICKTDLQKNLNLPEKDDIPIIGMVTRLADQKGLDIFVKIFEKIMTLDLQFVLLGTGEKKYHEIFEKYASIYSKKASINLGFNSVLAEKIYAGSDMFLMPSYFEPCGLGQLISMKFGTIPIVRDVGGLHDTVIPYSKNINSKKITSTGFIFDKYSEDALLSCIVQALTVYKDQNIWEKLMQNAMKKNFSWQASAKKYLEIYKTI